MDEKIRYINIEIEEKDYENLKKIVANEHRTIKATVTMLVLNYINGKDYD